MWRIVAICLISGIGVPIAEAQAPRGQDMRFAAMDRDNDGVVTRSEWRGSRRAFERRDWNGDGVLSGDEVRPGARRQAARRGQANQPAGVERDNEFFDWTDAGFTGLDRNRDARITADEWHFNREGFRRADHNADGVISRAEFLGGTEQQTGTAYRAGYERGRIEGLQAGREDGARKTWDLEGQRELESADSGYAQALGPRSEYQAGYRDGFRSAYREGFGR
jgi:hypothetical protein